MQNFLLIDWIWKCWYFVLEGIIDDESFSERLIDVLTFVFVGFSFDTKNGHHHDDDHYGGGSEQDHKPHSAIEGRLQALGAEVQVDFRRSFDLENK